MKCDCHIHMVLDGDYYAAAIAEHKNGAREDIVRRRLALYRDAGVTYLRDGGDSVGVALLAKSLAPEYGIEYAAPAFPIYKRGRYGAFIGLGYETEADYMALLDRAEAAGADFVKLMLAGIMDFDNYGVLSCEPLEAYEMKTLISRAHERGFRVMAHVNGDGAVKNALMAGADSVEHGNFMSEDTVKLLADSDAVWVPTLSPMVNSIGTGRFSDDVLRRIVDGQLKNIALASSQGAYIALGSDGGAWRVCHGECVMQEREAMGLALGAGADLVLGLGSARIREIFRRRENG
ncbi:MAG: amidohydrolase family protein [Candidatus Heteroscillospira sp.]|jgi:hypothetical protein